YYGFSESHAASFAILAYSSSWMKCTHPDVFRNRPLEAALCLRIVTGNLPSLTTSLLTSFGR
ncbi:hypothetical protein, partial [Komagataeibacter xylinus]|uniref:hypothetical protein n=1 Tax=Komagataeibacter xylinus TaxID=28448 RepID=UPI001C3F2069